MKTTIAILAVLFAAVATTAQAAPAPGVNLKIAGGEEDDVFQVGVSGDGRTYKIESNVRLEADSSICWPSEAPPAFVLHCKATAIAGFEISGGGGNDMIELVRVPVPATISGATGADLLIGGAAADKILGGPEKDFIEGRSGDDVLAGEEGADRMTGGLGRDRLEGGGGNDSEYGSAGSDTLLGGVGSDLLSGGPGGDVLVGGPGLDALLGGPGRDVVHQ